MLRHGFLGLSTLLPPDLKSMPTLQGMMGGMTPPAGDPTSAPPKDEFSFGNVGDAIDSKEAARYLQKKGLIGAGQIIESNPDINDANSIRNTQGDWKIAAMQQIVQNAKKFGLTKPEEILANKDVLVGNPRWKDAINNSSFQTIHPNWWSLIAHSIIPEQMSRDKTNSIAKK